MSAPVPGSPTTSDAATDPVRVAIVDDQALVRGGLAMLVDSQPDLAVTVQAGDGAEAVARLAEHPVDVVLMDVRMPVMDGIAATRRLLADHPDTRVIVLTTFELDDYVLRAIEAGASGFLLKDARPEQLLDAIRTVRRGDAVISPSMTRRLLSHVVPLMRSDRAGAQAASAPDAAPAPTAPPGADAAATEAGGRAEVTAAARRLVAALTPREREVLELVSAGLSNAEIADRLFLSETTVKTHVGHILAKLAARDRVQAVVIAFRAGVVPPLG
jgi:DNA-binding NarL/FixJ family response regulator